MFHFWEESFWEFHYTFCFHVSFHVSFLSQVLCMIWFKFISERRVSESFIILSVSMLVFFLRFSAWFDSNLFLRGEFLRVSCLRVSESFNFFSESFLSDVSTWFLGVSISEFQFHFICFSFSFISWGFGHWSFVFWRFDVCHLNV